MLALEYVGAEFLDKVSYYNTVWWPARALVEEAHTNRYQVCFLPFTYLLLLLL